MPELGGDISPASAAKEVGEPCTATGTEPNRTLLVFNANAAEIQPVVPEEPAQVITSWQVRVGPGIPPLPQQLEVYRVLNEEQDYRKEAEGETLVCNPAPQLAGSFEGGAALGETRRVSTSIGLGVPLTATVEDDRDGDGYGDETQDRCPQSAAYQAECPHVMLDTASLVERNSVTVMVSVSAPTTVSVSEKPGRQGAPPRAGTGRYPGFGSAVMTVAPAQIGRFKFHFYRGLKSTLKSLSSKKAMKLRFSVVASNLTGSPTASTLVVGLKGRAKPRPARRG